MSYCAISDVQGLNASRTAYSGSTKPTSTQVQGFIDQIAGEIDTILAGQNVVTPVTAPSGFVASLLHINALGAASLAESAQFPEFDSSTPGATPQSWRYYREYQDALQKLRNGTGIDPNAALTGTSLASTYLTDNPTNPGADESDGFSGAGWGVGQQPIFSMQREF